METIGIVISCMKLILSKARKDLIQIILDAEKDLKQLDDETKAVFDEGLGFSEKDKSGEFYKSHIIFYIMVI